MIFKCPLNNFIFFDEYWPKIKLNGLVLIEYSTSQSTVFVINVFFSYCICSQFSVVLVYNVAVYLYSVYSGRCILIGRCLEVKEGSGIQQIWQHKMSRNSTKEKEGKRC